MIYLKKGQPIFDNPGMVVYDPTGYYDDGTSVICSPVFAPEEPSCRYEAKYIAYGGIVYSISNQDELMKQILEIDPATLYGKDSKQVATDKIIDNIVPQETNQLIEDTVTEDTPPEEPLQKESPTTSPPEDILSSDTSTTTSTTTSPAVETPVIETPTVTPPEVPPSDTSTTTSTTTSPAVETPVIETPTVTPPTELITETIIPTENITEPLLE